MVKAADMRAARLRATQSSNSGCLKSRLIQGCDAFASNLIQYALRARSPPTLMLFPVTIQVARCGKRSCLSFFPSTLSDQRSVVNAIARLADDNLDSMLSKTTMLEPPLRMDVIFF